MKQVLFIVCSALTVIALPVSESESSEWELFKEKYSKRYESETEESYRFKIYMDNKKKIEEHNASYKKGETSYTLGVNKFTDMLFSEVKHLYTGYNTNKLKGKKTEEDSAVTMYVPPENVDLPDEVNWVKKGAVTPVKDQKECGSCWAFSSTGSLEGLEFLKTGKLISLSEQNLVDCSFEQGNEGCDGGLMSYAFTYVKQNKGLDTEKSYPYEGTDDVCRYSPENRGATDKGYVAVTQGSEDALKSAVATVGPISVAIYVSPDFFSYSGGIYDNPMCFNKTEDLDHAVLVVGYGTDDQMKVDYWLVKNSWSKSWGEEGYIRMRRNANNECGIATEAVYPKV